MSITGKLTDEEFEEMQKHTIYGRNAIERAEQSMHMDNNFCALPKK